MCRSGKVNAFNQSLNQNLFSNYCCDGSRKHSFAFSCLCSHTFLEYESTIMSLIYQPVFSIGGLRIDIFK